MRPSPSLDRKAATSGGFDHSTVMSASQSADGPRIAIDCLVVGEEPSGVERAVAGLLEGLAQQPAGKTEFLAVVASGAEDLVPPGSPVRPVAAPGWTRSRLGRVAFEQLALPQMASALGADLLHGAAFVLPLGWPGRSVVTIHDTITVSHPQWCKRLNRLHYGTVMTRSALQADAVIVPSEFACEEVVREIGVARERVCVAPLGVGAGFQPAGAEELERVRVRYGLPERYLLCVGNVEPRKNLDAVVTAFELIAERVPHGLIIAGKRGWKCEAASAAIEHGDHAGRISWLRWVPHEDLRALYSGADLLVQWSLHEGFGLTPLEAMACGTAAIISDGGALPEVAGAAALMAPLSEGAQGLAEAIELLLGDEAHREKLRAAGLEHAAGFTWERHAQIVSELYREVTGAQR